jgi:hypothetical protein
MENVKKNILAQFLFTGSLCLIELQNWSRSLGQVALRWVFPNQTMDFN